MLRLGIGVVVALGTVGVLVPACGGNVSTGTGGAASTSATTGSHAASSGSTSSGTGGSTSASSGASSSGGTCDPSKCMPMFICCGGGCVNPLNDIDNCGSCGHSCTGPNPYCHNGTCGTPPCMGANCTGGEQCCGNACCMAGMLCCDTFGPLPPPPPDYPTCVPPMNGTCPPGCTGCTCASPDTPIATPDGERPIADLAAGDLVYSVDHGAVVAVPVLRANRTPVRDHHVVRVRLAGGAVLEVSPRHPTADGRTFADLRAGGTLDGLAITSAELVPYGHPFTYDILPASETHTYYAAGALVGTTLAP